MEVSGTAQEANQVQQVSSKAEQLTVGSKDEFAKLLRSFLPNGGASETSEEELFSSVVRERMRSTKGEEGLAAYDKILSSSRAKYTRADGFVQEEKLTNASLAQAISSGILTQAEANSIYSQAFSAAQLDSNTDTLWDSRSGKNDPSRAVAATEEALSAAYLGITSLLEGKTAPSERVLPGGSRLGSNPLAPTTTPPEQSSADITYGATISGNVLKPSGTSFDGTEGFLFKPVSENQGTLAVLLPEALKQQVSSVTVHDAEGNELDRGSSTGYGDTGAREKFSFSKQGSEFPKDIYVHVTTLDGRLIKYLIPDPSQRYD